MRRYKRYGIIALFLPMFFLICSPTKVETIKWTIILSSDENGSVCDSGTRHVNENDSISIFACQAANHYGFNEWVILSGAENCIIHDKFNDTTVIKNITGPVSIKALFELNSYQLITKPACENGNITISPQPINGKYSDGQQINLTAITDTGWNFVNWNGASNSTNSTITIVLTKDTTISATFSEITVPSGVICVWPNSPSASKNGSNWAHAYTTISDAIANSSTNSEIWIMQGTYSQAATYAPNAGTKFYGGFTGSESALSERNWQIHPTILRGDGGVSSYGFNISSANANVVFDGLTFTSYSKIVLYCVGANTQIINCCFKNNTSPSAVNLRSLGNTVSNCIFKNNDTASTSNGGKALYSSSASKNNLIVNSLFFQNGGPAIRDDNTDRTNASKINNCTIVKNGSSSSASGGLVLTGATDLNGDIIYYNVNNSGNTYGRQVDSTFNVTSCAIQMADSKDTMGCDRNYWSTLSVTSADPVFIANIPNTDLSTITDSTWYSKINTSIPLLLNSSSSPLLNKYYSGGPTSDIRGVTRGHYFDVGAYESANPNQ